MPRPLVLCVLTFVILAAGLVTPALAQDDDEQRVTGYNAIIDNVDLLVENYAGFLARKYDLTEEQDEYTKCMLRERTYEFLGQHEENLRGLIDRLFDVRTGGEMNPDELIQWGQQVQPVYEEAKRLIVDGNTEWREILTDEQKKIHDEDVRLMYESFNTTEEKLGRILSGEMTVEEFRSPQRGRRATSRSRSRAPAEESPVIADEPVADRPDEPPPVRKMTPRRPDPAADRAATGARRSGPTERPTRPRTTVQRSDRSARESDPRMTGRDRALATRERGKSSSKKPESQWEKYVREFVAKYKLNDEQSQKAYQVLEDCQSQRDRLLRGRKEQLEKLDQQIEELKKSKDKKKAQSLTQLADKRRQLMAPIDQIFDQRLKPRLERLPTRAQRRAAEAATKTKTPTKRSSLQKTSIKKPPTKKPPKKTTVKKAKEPTSDDDE